MRVVSTTFAEKIWCKTGKKADVGGATEQFSLESGTHVEDSQDTDNPDPKKKRKVTDNTLPCLSSDNEEEEDQATDKAIVPGPRASVETVKKRIPPMTPKVGAEVDMPTVIAGPTKRSHN